MISPHLKGFSGASLEIRQSNGGMAVRKTALSEQQGIRLKRQALKQLNFSKADLPVATPRVFNEGIENGRYFFEMEFIRGINGQLFLERCSFAQLRDFADQLTVFLTTFHSRPPLTESPHLSWFDASVHKLLDVQKATDALPSPLLGHLFNQLEGLRELSGLSPGFCHGDLTLENIMVDSDQKIWAIDFLDSPFEHPWQDYIKLDQEILGEWYMLKGRRISAASIAYLRDRICRAITEIAPQFFKFRHILLALNFCRILPYASDQRELGFLLSRIEHFSHLKP